MTPAQLIKWRHSLPRDRDGLPVTKAEAARMLNNTPPNSYGDWEAGRRRPPRMLALACYAVSRGWRVPKGWMEDES